MDCPGPNKNTSPNFNNRDSSHLEVVSLIPDNKETAYVNTSDTLNKPILYTKIFPNPSTGAIDIEFEGDINRDIRIEIFDASGQSILQIDRVEEKKLHLDLSYLPAGIYYLTGTFEGKIISEKIVID